MKLNHIIINNKTINDTGVRPLCLSHRKLGSFVTYLSIVHTYFTHSEWNHVLWPVHTVNGIMSYGQWLLSLLIADSDRFICTGDQSHT